jgi:hypothetical protein
LEKKTFGACLDYFNDRVIVVDPRTSRIVRQYGRADGVDLVPPAALMTRLHARIRLPG